jgi:beta-galactosidase
LKSACCRCLALARFACLALLLGTAITAPLPSHANDHMFPAAPAAKAYSDYDRKGFLINGKRTFLVSAGMEYARVPHELWRDRLLRLKRAGFNCVEVYTFWNWHEPQEGKFDFKGDHDLGAFLKLVKQMDMFAICRVGPYYCAEWDNGGYPLWLRFKPGLKVRDANKPFLDAMDRFFEKLIPVVAANQINHGGSVVLVQLENEGAGWGTEEPNAYFTHLREKAVALGLQVPYFFSGLHHSNDPAGDTAMDDPNRPNPWISTEFWSVWYDVYGSRPQDAPTYARRTWKIIAHGGNGYNYYMAHGGTNFAYTNNNEDAACYDYGTGVGQAGDLRPLYYAFKRAAWFARSFQEILENAGDGTAEVQGTATEPSVRVTARKGPAGTILFLDNPGKTPTQTQVKIDGMTLPAAGPITLAPNDIVPVVRDFALAPGVTLKWAVSRILGVVPQGNTTTLVIYGQAGSPADLRFTVAPNAQIEPGGEGLRTAAPGTLDLSVRFRDGDALEYAFKVGTRRVRILAVSDTLADRTWFVDTAGQTHIVCGPGYIGESSLGAGLLHLTTERPWQETLNVPIAVYGPNGPQRQYGARSAAPAHPMALSLDPWEVKDAALPAAPAYDDRDWKASDAPMQMGADGDLTADAWYRARIQVPKAGQYTLHANGGDRAIVFVDGARVANGKVHSDIPVMLEAGSHTLAIFTAHDGRDKLFGYVGPVDNSDPKGLSGPVTLRQGSGTALNGWRVWKGVQADAVKTGPPAADGGSWQSYSVGEDAFAKRHGFAWFQTTIPATTGAAHVSLHFESVDDNGTVFVNGKQVASHKGWDTAFDVPISAGPEAVLSVFVENTDNTGGLDKPVRLVTQIGEEVRASGWKLRGGPGDPMAPSDWNPLVSDRSFVGPAFFRTTFTAAPPPAEGPHPIWRVVSTGLGHGSVWVNGHNLGRYPEKVPINGLYIPECWLVAGRNSLVIYDEDGMRPDGVTIAAEVAASRDISTLISPR